MTRLKCSDCQQTKESSRFGPDKMRVCRGGRAYICRDCVSIRTKQWYQEHKEVLQPKMKERMAKWRAKNPDKARQINRNSTYRRIGMSGENQYSEQYEKQKGLCAVCGRWKPKFGRAGLHADHSHASNTPRGLVCARCNMLIGFYETAYDLWAKVEIYLKTYEK